MVYVMVNVILLWFRVGLQSAGDQLQHPGEPQKVFLAACKPMPLILASRSQHSEI